MSADLRKLGRKELLQMLIKQSEEVEALKHELAIAHNALQQRSITINEAGSIAEAALKLNGIFEAAELACRQYTESVMLQNQQLLAEAQRMAAAIKQDALQKQQLVLTQARNRGKIYHLAKNQEVWGEYPALDYPTAK